MEFLKIFLILFAVSGVLAIITVIIIAEIMINKRIGFVKEMLLEMDSEEVKKKLINIAKDIYKSSKKNNNSSSDGFKVMNCEDVDVRKQSVLYVNGKIESVTIESKWTCVSISDNICRVEELGSTKEGIRVKIYLKFLPSLILAFLLICMLIWAFFVTFLL